MPPPIHPVDEKLPLPRLLPLALQHVLVMQAGAVARTKPRRPPPARSTPEPGSAHSVAEN